MNTFGIGADAQRGLGAGMTLPLLFLATVVWWIWQRHKANLESGLPGTFGLPFIGETLTYVAKMKSPLGNFVDEKTKRYNGAQAFKSSLFFQPTVIATEVETVKMIVAKEGRSFVSNYPSSFALLLGRFNGLNMNGENWKRLRKFVISHIMRVDLLKERMADIEDLVVRTLDSWADDEGRTIYVEDETKTIAFNITALIVLNLKPGKVSQTMQRDYYPLIEGMFSLPINLPWTIYGKATQARVRILKTLEEFLQSRTVKDDVFDNYVQLLQEELPPGSPPALKHEMGLDLLTSLLFAGHDTTAATMVFSVKYIGENPKVLAELRREHEELLKRKQPGERISWDDCKTLSFSNSIITETLRMCNISTTVFRKSLEDVHVGDYVIPKGWLVLPYFRAVHFNPSIYPDPYTFNPFRYQDAAGSKLPFFGFGGGARLCPGMDLARAELCLFLHHLVMKFESWELLGNDVVSYFPFPRLSARLPIRVKRRTPPQQPST